ncbi:hypothetical protein A2704_05610 [Candidatus Kaiserbacteria bacterium RIFCSPHIGHO2_01_FULL_54_36b]|uniref:Uncharacterized protein n=1 Tax=Candidatus Kaiserbacteria bacterium RIFCSPHIGHO2_01_FULL_54_36b TaxID=1798483 RepID=A0A1F6CMB4_9BACT|nr:MAG: hypothetical protein A2704_05610 [Candidatus Kaiserbacteria bacterium RIFCSPHIGHO2_01_FULL_54_36b]
MPKAHSGKPAFADPPTALAGRIEKMVIRTIFNESTKLRAANMALPIFSAKSAKKIFRLSNESVLPGFEVAQQPCGRF